MGNVNKQIDEYIISHPRGPEEVGYYSRLAKLFNVDSEHIRNRWRKLRKTLPGLSAPTGVHFMRTEPLPSPESYIITNTDNKTYHFDMPSGQGSVQFETQETIGSLEDIIRVCDIDTDKFEVTSYNIKSYNAWIKNEQKEIENKQLFSVHASLKAKKTDTSLDKQKDIIIEEMKNHNPYKLHLPTDFKEWLVSEPLSGECALEISIPDLHIGKLAWGKETGEDYDIQEAVSRYKKAIKTILERVPLKDVNKIILPVGNDMINVDSKFNLTTAGTPVSCDSRFGKMFQTTKNLLINTIEKLSAIAPVDVVVISGNHDTHSMFTLGEVLDAWFHDNPIVHIFNQPTQRKYYQYGNTALMFTHGNEEKHTELGMIFAAEQPQLWADTKYRFCQLGHFHKTKKLNFVSVDEHQGFQVEIIPSLSGTDAWHNQKGYHSLKGAKAYLYHKDQGRIAEYSYYI